MSRFMWARGGGSGQIADGDPERRQRSLIAPVEFAIVASLEGEQLDFRVGRRQVPNLVQRRPRGLTCRFQR